jgi:hypothetical protein
MSTSVGDTARVAIFDRQTGDADYRGTIDVQDATTGSLLSAA